MGKSGFIHPSVYFEYGFFNENGINPNLTGRFARSTANKLRSIGVPIPVLEFAYVELYNVFERESGYGDTEDISDIMRASIFCEPFINFKFLIEFIDFGLIAAESEDEIEAFFVHFHKVIDICKYSNLEGVIEY